MVQRPVVEDKRDTLPHAYLHNNWVNNGHFTQLAAEYDLTGLDFHLLFKLSSTAQLKNNGRGGPRLRYGSRYALLQHLGWPNTGFYLDALIDGLLRLRDVEVEMDWLGKLRPDGRHAHHKGVCFDGFMSPRERDGHISLTFPKPFWNTNLPETGKWSKIWPHEIRPLVKFLPDVLLYLLLRTFRDKIVDWDHRIIARRMGLQMTGEKAIIDRIEKAVTRLNEATPCDFDVDTHQNKNGDTAMRIDAANPYKSKTKRNVLGSQFDKNGNYLVVPGYRLK